MESGRALAEVIFVGYIYFSTYDTEPLFCFGHGLSYTTFKYEDLKVSVSEKVNDVDILVKFKLTNHGYIDGAEVVQVYIKDLKSSIERPKMELKEFDKIYLNAGESKEIEIKLNKKALAFYDSEEKNWLAESGEFEVLIGASSEDIRVADVINVKSSYKF